MKKPPTDPLRCRSCGRGWALIRVIAKGMGDLFRCCACGFQNNVDEATEAARAEARRRQEVWA